VSFKLALDLNAVCGQIRQCEGQSRLPFTCSTPPLSQHEAQALPSLCYQGN